MRDRVFGGERQAQCGCQSGHHTGMGPMHPPGCSSTRAGCPCGAAGREGGVLGCSRAIYALLGRPHVRHKVAGSGLLLCHGHKGKCWVQRLGTGPGRGFQLAQRFAGCDDWAGAQTLMSWQFLCAPARGLPLPGYKVGASLRPETQARSLQQEPAAAQVRGHSHRAAAGPEAGRRKGRGSAMAIAVVIASGSIPGSASHCPSLSQHHW